MPRGGRVRLTDLISIRVEVHKQPVPVKKLHRVVILVHNIASGPYPDLVAQEVGVGIVRRETRTIREIVLQIILARVIRARNLRACHIGLRTSPEGIDVIHEHDYNLTNLDELYKRMVTLYRNFNNKTWVTIVNFRFDHEKQTVN